MSSPFKKVSPGEKVLLKSRGTHSRASHDLRRLQALLVRNSRPEQVSAPGPSKASGGGGASRSKGPPTDPSRLRRESDAIREASELEKFSVTYRKHRCFSRHPLSALFSDVMASLVKNRLCSGWIRQAQPEAVLRVLTCLRLLIRDPEHQKILHQLQGIAPLAQYLESVAATFLSRGDQPFAVQTLVTITYVFQRVSAGEGQKVWVIESGAHKTLVRLLSTTESSVVLGALLALSGLAESPECREKIGELPVVENLLVILQEHQLLSKRASGELLRLLSPVRQVRDQVRELEGLPVLLSLLSGPSVKLLWSVAWVLVQLCQDPDTRTEIRSWGGVPQLLRLLAGDGTYVCDQTLSSAAGRIQREQNQEELSPQEGEGEGEGEGDSVAALQSACCAVLTELSLDDSSARHVVQENGVYVIARLVLRRHCGPKTTCLQIYAFRTLRFLFSVERNRHLFKRLFPTELFELFIDVGHYVRDLSAYERLQTEVSRYTEEEVDRLRQSIEAVDQNRPPLRTVNGYSILDHLGTGAFGSVFKVQKQSSQNLLALKEVNLHNPAFGNDKKSREKNVEKIISELTIIREQMTHPNIVRYYRTFLEGERLYVVMELIDGAPLAEHFSSLKEKQQRFSEDRMWNIFIQMCLALRYLHQDKRIVHRDLTPNNVMLGDGDRVTITDFGLAKQKQESSKLTSVVGTILYSCPEVVKNEPYGEKADIWALGCIFYQMAALEPPFYSSNMLSLASKIVDGVYEPIKEGVFSTRVTEMIRWCLSPDPDQRPDILAVSSRISDLMMRLMDGLFTSQNALQRRAERDRKRAQKYFLERQTSRNLSHTNDKETPPPTCSSAHSPPKVTQGQTVTATGKQSSDDASDGEAEPSDTKVNTAAFTASAGICVSQRKVRQIDDPIRRLLVQLHKILFITQLPPATNRSRRRRLVENFKKSLFSCESDSSSLKVELSKLLQASPDLMDFSSTCSDWFPLVHGFTGDPQAAGSSSGDGSLKDGVTYQQMQELIEELLQESSYYQTHSRRVPEQRGVEE